MEINQTKINAEDFAGESNDEGEPEPEEQAQEQPQEYKEFFQIETPKGIKISSGSSSRPAEYLAELVMGVYNMLNGEQNNGTKTFYTG